MSERKEGTKYNLLLIQTTNCIITFSASIKINMITSLLHYQYTYTNKLNIYILPPTKLLSNASKIYFYSTSDRWEWNP